ncbi:MAG: endolytic transglycosylase MltG [Peptoniphilus sp.]|uniref:endolytic transglycosylase MltG n=1 Tax=Peptoniphilus sp. TaxID=1971214 RepID=UPI0025DF05CB|nr:endolytic transglycosylase MltG [Peptoniphilus sp.]MCI5642780.1 endolytic transglycosylase MltG [Peptoniphilus sp.]MDY3902771.1 endolytic transglycosylase MltG [Peptoniphilus sp.]
MNNFNRGKLFFIKFLQVLLSILFFLALVFVIKWRIDSLYLNSISNRKVQLSIVDEFTKTANEILVATGLKDEKSVKPIVALDEGKEENEETDNTKAKITIPEGTNVDGLGEILMSKGLIKDLNAYKALVDDMQIGNKIVPGTYDLNKGLKVREILAKISNTNLKTYNININEGATPADVAKTLMDNGVIVSQQAFVDSCNNLGVTAFAPGTHEILMPSKVANIIKSLAKN